MNNKQFAIALSVIVVLDSYFTMKIGYEANVIYLWLMEKFSLTLGQLMFWRIPVVLSLIYFIYKFGTKNVNVAHATILYFAAYAMLSAVQFFPYFLQLFA